MEKRVISSEEFIDRFVECLEKGEDFRLEDCIVEGEVNILKIYERIKEKIKDEKLKAKLLARIDLLSEKGEHLTMPHAQKLKNTNDIWELRLKYKKNQYRILYFFAGDKIILLHAFIKKTQSIPDQAIRIAEKRKREWERRFLS